MVDCIMQELNNSVAALGDLHQLQRMATSLWSDSKLHWTSQLQYTKKKFKK